MLGVAAKTGARVVMGKSHISYILLNVLRGLNILCILSCITASGCLMVKTAPWTDEIGIFNVFDIGEKAMIIMFGVFLLLSESPKPKSLHGYFGRNWPLFSYGAGFFTLAVCLWFLAFDVLSYLTKENSGKDEIGGDFYRMVQAAGWMTLVVGVLNVVGTVVLKDKKQGLTSRQVRDFKNQPAETV